MSLNEIENEDSYPFDQNDQLLDATRIQMVLGSLEKSLVDKVLANSNALDIDTGAAAKTTKYFLETYRRKPENLEELIRKSNLSQLPGLARQAMQGSSKQKYFERLDQLINVLQIYKTRSQSFAHPGNEYSPVHWARVQALALDPVIKQLGFLNVIERYIAAKKGNLDFSEINENTLTEIPNNLPLPDFDEIIGRDKLSAEIKKYLLNPRKPSISIFGAGGTGKTALTLSVLNELKFCEEDSKKIDMIIYSSLKEEFLEEGLVRKEIVDLTIEGIKKQLIEGYLYSNSEFGEKNIFEETFNFDSEDNINLQWEEFINTFSNYRFLLWIDNLETLSNDIYEVFSDFENTLPRDWKIIITSRIRIRESSSIISLGPLDINSGARLFQKIYQDKLGKKVAFHDASEYAKKLFCNPLAIKNAVGYQKRNNTSLIESIQCGADSIISFSFTKLVSSLSKNSKDCLEVLFVFGESRKIDINKRISVDVDSVSESISEIEDLGLATRGTSSLDCIKLNDNFRSYLSLYPLNEDLRFNLNIYKDENINKQISPSSAENNQWSSQMKFSYLRPETQIDNTCRVICTEAIGSLGSFYNIKDKELVSNETKEIAYEKLRDSLKELEEFRESNEGQKIPPAVYRLIGLIYQEFNDQVLCNKYLGLAAEGNDPNALLTIFYRYDALQDNRAIEYGFRFYESLSSPLPDSVPYSKFMTAFTKLLIRQNKFDDVYKVTSDWKSRKDINKSLFLTLMAEAYICNGKHLIAEMVDENKNQEYANNISDLFIKSFECLDIDSTSPYYTSTRDGIYWWLITSINGFTRRSLTNKYDFTFKADFLKMIISIHRNYLSNAFNESFNYQKLRHRGDKLKENLIKITAAKEYFEDVFHLIRENEPIQEKNKLNIRNTRWYETKRSLLRFKNFAGFDKKLAIFEDSENKTYRITRTSYNFFESKKEATKGKLINFYRLTTQAKLDASVYKFYTSKVFESRLLILDIHV